MNRARAPHLGQALSLAFCLAVAWSFASQASAQATGTGVATGMNPMWLPDRQYSEGPGVKVGELELHPGVALRAGYNSNVFLADGKTRNGIVPQPIRDAAVLAVTPHLYLTTETEQRAQQGEDKPAAPRLVEFRGGLSATYFHYFLDNAPRNVAIDTDFLLSVARGRPVGLDVVASYRRSVSPFTQNARQRNAYNYDVVDPKLRLTFSSHSRVLTGFVGYAPNYRHYESSTFNYLNNIQHGIELGTAWRFLPSTALVYDGSFALQDYLNQDSGTLQTLLYSNNKFIRSRLGINGAITNNLSLRVMAGYVAGLMKHPALDDLETALAEATLTYKFGFNELGVGYLRDAVSSPLGAWYQTDGGAAHLALVFARRFRLRLEGNVAHAVYGRVVRLDGAGNVVGMGVNRSSSRKDIRVGAALRGEYRVNNWLAFMADVVYQSIITDFQYASSTSTGQLVPDPAGYNQVTVYGGLRFSY